MSEEIEMPEGILESALAADNADWQEVAAGLSRRPEAAVRAALQKLVRDRGADSVGALEQLAMAGSPSVAATSVQALGSVTDASAAVALERIAATTASSDVRKAARRALHRLSSMRVASGRAAPQPEPTRPSQQPERVRTAIASSIDGEGNRGIRFAVQGAGGLDVVSVLLNDQEGVKDAFVHDVSASVFARDAGKALKDPDFPWVEMPPDYCRHLVEVTHRKNAAAGTPLPVEFLAWRDEISRPRGSYDQPIVYSVIGAAEVRWDPRFLDHSDHLFDLNVFKGWILDRDELAEFVQERLSAERSGLVLAGVSGEARDRMIEERAIQTLFDGRRRLVYKGRLEGMSYLLWKLGRFEAAREALAAALALEPADRPLSDHPFVRAMVTWSLEVVSEMARGERTRAVRPGVQLHLPY